MVRNVFRNIHNRLKHLIAAEKKDAIGKAGKQPYKRPLANASEGKETNEKKPELISAPPKRPNKRRRKRKKKQSAVQPPGSTVSTPRTGQPPAEKDRFEPWDPSQFQVPLADGKLRFHDLDLPEALMRAIFDLGFQYCTPVQAEILPAVLQGQDATGKAQTGTGKTAAFLISIFTRMLQVPIEDKRRSGTPRVLIIAPTRELAIQITDEAIALSRYCQFNILSVFGGMDYEKQRRQLRGKPVDVLVATPGRLLDYQRQRELYLNHIEVLIIDEADRMLDMGFIPDVRRIIHSTPPKNQRQTMFFSATLKPEVIRLAAQWTRDPIRVEIEPDQVAADSVNQMVYITTSDEKAALLYNIITRQNLTRAIVFCNRRDETRRLTEFLQRYGIKCAMISGEIAQNKRLRTLEGFRAGEIRVMVATDVAGRGIHVEAVSHVINYTLPHDPEDYVHRIGRTGRAGATGTSISFACEDDSFYIPDIETFIGGPLNCIQPDENWLKLPPMPPGKPQHTSKPRDKGGHRKQQRTRRRPNRPKRAG